MVRSGNRTDSLDINVLPDARILFDENERLLLLTDPGDAYKHGILGDVNEATAVTIVGTDPEAEQPFTRSLGSIEIPDTVEKVLVRARCNVHGYGPRTVMVDLGQPEGESFEVIGGPR